MYKMLAGGLWDVTSKTSSNLAKRRKSILTVFTSVFSILISVAAAAHAVHSLQSSAGMAGAVASAVFGLLAFISLILSLNSKHKASVLILSAVFLSAPFAILLFGMEGGKIALSTHTAWTMPGILLLAVFFKPRAGLIAGLSTLAALSALYFPLFSSSAPLSEYILSAAFIISGALLSLIFTLAGEQYKNILNERDIRLFKGEERYRNLLESTLEAVVVHNDFKISQVNASFEQMFGVNLSECHGSDVSDYIVCYKDNNQEICFDSTNKEPVEALGKAADGSTFYIEILNKVFGESGKKSGLISIRNISARKIAEINQKRSELDFKTLVDKIPDIVYRIDNKGKFAFVNEAVKELGYEPANLIGKHFSEILHPDDIDEVSRSEVLQDFEGKKTSDKHAPKLFDERRAGFRKTANLELRLITKDWKDLVSKDLVNSFGSSIVCGEVSSSGVYDHDETSGENIFLGTVGIIKDVTQRKIKDVVSKKDAEIAESALQAALPDITYRIDKDGKFTFVSDSIRHLNYDPQDLVGKHFSAVMHPQSVKHASAETVLPGYKGLSTGDKDAPKLFDERRTGERKTNNLELWFVRKNFDSLPEQDMSEIENITQWGEISSFTEYDESTPDKDREFLGRVGIIRNITQRKKTENALREYTENIEKSLKVKQQNIEKAQLLQRNLNTNSLPQTPVLDILSYYMPCEELGGDFFDVRIENGKIIIIMADSIGHGIEASMDATLLKSISDRYVELLVESEPGKFLENVNNDLIQYSYEEDKFSTMFVCVIDTQSLEMIYSHANSEIPFIVNNGEVKTLERPIGFHLGFDSNTKFEQIKRKLLPGDIVLFYSDALIEMKEMRSDKQFGVLGIKQLMSSFGNGLRKDVNTMKDTLKHRYGSFPLEDDLTVILLEVIEPVVRSFSLAADVYEIERKLTEIKYYLVRLGYSDRDLIRFQISFDEIGKNAISHGSKNDPNKTIKINAHIDFEKAVISIEDEGSGFNPESIPDPTDYTRLISIIEFGNEEELTHGRGIWMVRQHADLLEYNSSGNRASFTIKRENRRALFQYY